MKLEDVVKVIKDQIIECKNIGSMFDMPFNRWYKR